MNEDLISRSALLERSDFEIAVLEDGIVMVVCAVDVREIMKAPAVDAVSRKVVEQIMWERDTAMEQLKEHGIPFGGIAPDVVAVVRCKDCKWLYNGLDMYCCTKHTGLALITTDGSGFCSYGERMGDE